MEKVTALAGRLSDTTLTDKVSCATEANIYYGVFVTQEFKNGARYVKPANKNVEGLTVTLRDFPHFAYANDCVPVLRYGRAYARVKEGVSVQAGDIAKVNTDGLIDSAGEEVPNVLIIGDIKYHDVNTPVVEVQIDPFKVIATQTEPAPETK